MKKKQNWGCYFYLGMLKYALIYPQKIVVQGFASMKEIEAD